MMKLVRKIKLFLLIAVVCLSFSSCLTEINNNSFVNSNLISSMVNTNPDSRWNTTLLQNHKNNGGFFYNNRRDEIYYCKDEIINGKHTYSLVVRSDDGERKIIDTYAQSIYVLDQTIYFSTETGIQSIQIDGSNAKTILTLSMDTLASYIFPYKDTIFYLSDNWQIYQINLINSTQKALTTSENVFYYMIYNDCIYYAGFGDELYGLSCSLRRYDLKTCEDTLLVKNISAFDILNDTIYFFNQDGDVSSANINGNQQGILFSDNDLYTDSLYITDTDLLYFTMKEDGSCFYNKYNFNSKKREEICSISAGEWSVCGKYLCLYAPYELTGEIYQFKKWLNNQGTVSVKTEKKGRKK